MNEETIHQRTFQVRVEFTDEERDQFFERLGLRLDDELSITRAIRDEIATNLEEVGLRRTITMVLPSHQVRERRATMTKRRLNEGEARQYTTHCPHCGVENFYAYGMEAEGPEMWQRFRCNDCDTVWTEAFLLYAIEQGEDNNGEDKTAYLRLLSGCEGETEATADCGCKLTREEDGDVALRFCPMHEGAERLEQS